MIIFKKITFKSKAGFVLINYSHAILDQEIQNNGGCPEAAGPDRERFLQPRKYQKYPHRSWLGNWLWALIVKIQGYCYLTKYRVYLQKLNIFRYLMFNRTDKCTKIRYNQKSIIQHARYGQQCCISAVPSLNSSTLKTSSISTNSWGPELFKTLQETSYILFRLIFHAQFIWCPLDISRAFKRTTHTTISSTLSSQILCLMPENIIGLIALREAVPSHAGPLSGPLFKQWNLLSSFV